LNPQYDKPLSNFAFYVNLRYYGMEGGSVGYIRLTEFNALAEPGVASAVTALRAQAGSGG
jgi:C-terminal processing protease CtpA/Prc